jgi:hypothetical protein
MIYFRKQQIDNLTEFQEKVLKQLPNECFSQIGVLHQYHNELMKIVEIKNLITQLNLDNNLSYTAIITMPPNAIGPVHIDGGEIDSTSLNIPILNCKNTFMSWYTSTETLKRVELEKDKVYYGADLNTCIKVASVEMTDSYFVNIKELHNGHNPNNTWRILLSIRLTNFNL